jgi:hypothetical protein
MISADRMGDDFRSGNTSDPHRYWPAIGVGFV